jgi:hypothetical protein
MLLRSCALVYVCTELCSSMRTRMHLQLALGGGLRVPIRTRQELCCSSVAALLQLCGDPPRTRKDTPSRWRL